MKHITFIILFILSIINANELINKSFSFNSHHSTFKILSDSLYYIISNSADEKYINKRGAVLSLDKLGSTTHFTEIGTVNNYIISGIQVEDKHLLLIGYSQKNEEWSRIYLTKLNKNMEIVWEENYGSFNNDNKGYAIIQLNSNEYWVLGYTKASKNGVLLLKIDTNGKEKWFTYLPDLVCTFANNLILTKNQDLIISGQNKNQLFVARLDKEGNVLWQYNYNDDKKYHRSYDIKETKDGGFIVVGNSTATKDNSYDILIIKLSKNGDKEWIKTIGDNTNEVAYDVEINKDYGYIVSGHALTDKSHHIYNSFIIKIDSLGNRISRFNFNDSSNKLYDLTLDYNKKLDALNYVGTGNIFNKKNKESSIWFIKINDSLFNEY